MSRARKIIQNPRVAISRAAELATNKVKGAFADKSPKPFAKASHIVIGDKMIKVRR